MLAAEPVTAFAALAHSPATGGRSSKVIELRHNVTRRPLRSVTRHIMIAPSAERCLCGKSWHRHVILSFDYESRATRSKNQTAAELKKRPVADIAFKCPGETLRRAIGRRSRFLAVHQAADVRECVATIARIGCAESPAADSQLRHDVRTERTRFISCAAVSRRVWDERPVCTELWNAHDVVLCRRVLSHRTSDFNGSRA